MNIFRSEDDAKAWTRFDAGQGAILPVAAVVGMFGHPLFAERLKPDYYPRQEALFRNFMGADAAE